MSNFIRRATAIAGSLLLSLVASHASAQQQGVTDNEIVLGEILPLTGVASVGSLGLSAGNKMAIAEANASGGINGRKIRLVSEDDGFVVARAIQSYRKLVTSDKVFALTATSGAAASSALLPMLKESGIPAINTLSFPEAFWNPVVPNIFVSGATHVDSAEALATQMNKRFPNKKWAIITQNDDVGVLLRQGFEKAQKALNLQVVYTTIYQRGTKDFSAEILAVKNAGAEILFAGGILTENIAMTKELERLDYRIPVGISWIGRQSSATLSMMGTAAENVYLIDYDVADDAPAGRAFAARAQKYLTADEFKRFNRYTMNGYAGTKVLIDAMNRCGKALTWACTVKELNATKNFDSTVMGPISFSPTSHFSKQNLQLMKANIKTFTYQPLQ